MTKVPIRRVFRRSGNLKIMAKNTFSSAFRKIDVDQFNEDNFRDDDGPVQDRQGGGVNQKEVENLIRSGKNADALVSLLSTAPIGNKNQAEKVN